MCIKIYSEKKITYLYMPMISNPFSSTIDVHTSTINGTNSERVDCGIKQSL